MLILLCCAMAHLVVTAVMALFARHQVKYLAIAWIMGIFTIILFALVPYHGIATGRPGMLHPYMLLALVVVSYLQSIYPLSIPMPGYLQWGRMCRYASPAILLIVLYVSAFIMGSRPVLIYSFSDLRHNLLSSDILMRLVALLLSMYYILNIFHLPRKLTHVEFPGYLVGYSTILGLSVVFYLIVAINYDTRLMMVYIVLFTSLNLYLCFRTLETMALELPKPVIEEVDAAPTDEELKKAEADFNEMNLQRFHRVQYWMQQNRDVWTDNTFNRDNLCEQVGLNRHLLLECVRSQGFNNVHDYINSYRIDELKRRIKSGQVTNLTECLDAGFGAVKTVRSCFLKQEGATLDEYLQTHSGKSS